MEYYFEKWNTYLESLPLWGELLIIAIASAAIIWAYHVVMIPFRIKRILEIEREKIAILLTMKDDIKGLGQIEFMKASLTIDGFEDKLRKEIDKRRKGKES